MGTLLDAAWSVSSWQERRKTALLPIQRSLGVEPSDVAQSADWNAIPTAAYLGGPPLSYYLEPSFSEYFKFLNDRYKTDLALFAADLASCGQDVWKGLAFAESIAHEIYSTDIEQFDDYKKVSSHLNPWYLRLVEQAFDSLLTLPAYRLQQDVGKGVSLTPRGIHDAMKKHGWLAVGSYYDATMRNGIGHDIDFVQEGVTSRMTVRYRDAKGNSLELSLAEVIENVEGLSDECLAYCFALRLFVFENRDARELATVAHAATENFMGRELYFRRTAGSQVISIDDVNQERVNNQVQIRIECTDTTTHDHERLVEVLSILAIASDWFPEGETFFLGLRGKKRWPACLRISGEDLRRWITGDIADEDLPKCFDPYMLWPLKKWFGYSRAKWRRVLAAGMNRSKQDSAWRDHSSGRFSSSHGTGFVEDISTGLARRYSAIVVTDATAHTGVRNELAPLVNEIRSIRVYSNPQGKKRWGTTKPHFVSVFVFSREKRRRDCWANSESQFYVGKFEWRDPTFDPEQLPLIFTRKDAEVLNEGTIRYEANPNWPPKDLFVPRS